MKRRWLVFTAGAIVVLLVALGIIMPLESSHIMPINFYSPDPDRRMKALLNESEDLRVIQKEWERAYFTAPETKAKGR